MISAKNIMLAIAFSVLLGGCAKEYVYTPPATAVGRQCVAHCERSHAVCQRRTGTPAHVHPPKRRYRSAATRACGNVFRGCYQHCGGTVRVLR